MEFVINFDILRVHWLAVWSHSHSVCAGTVPRAVPPPSPAQITDAFTLSQWSESNWGLILDDV